MKILWIVNTIFTYPAKQISTNITCYGGWLESLAKQIEEQDEIQLAIATVYNGNKIKEFNDGKVIYYLIPGSPAIKYNKRLEKYWQEINKRFKPDLVHIHGTEFSHGLAFINACPEVKVITSIQGLVSVISKVYLANITEKEVKKCITVRDIIKHDTILNQKEKFENRGKNEIELIKKSDVVIGRTTWDYANTKAINNNEKYYKINEILRNSFYENEWNIENIEQHSIFTSQANYPIKGLHYLLRTIYILKKQYPDVKLYIAGNNILDKSTLMKRIKFNGYAKYLSKLIKKYNLEKQVNFTGILNENEMCERYLKSNVFVLPSAIENSSNSLCEAMILGMPCVASNTGGTMDMLEHQKEGFLYPYTEPAMCAEYIKEIFENEELAKEFGQKARERALERHNKEKNVKETIKIYKEMLGENRL